VRPRQHARFQRIADERFNQRPHPTLARGARVLPTGARERPAPAPASRSATPEKTRPGPLCVRSARAVLTLCSARLPVGDVTTRGQHRREASPYPCGARPHRRRAPARAARVSQHPHAHQSLGAAPAGRLSQHGARRRRPVQPAPAARCASTRRRSCRSTSRASSSSCARSSMRMRSVSAAPPARRSQLPSRRRPPPSRRRRAAAAPPPGRRQAAAAPPPRRRRAAGPHAPPTERCALRAQCHRIHARLTPDAGAARRRRRVQ